jgi:hypothetical protein
MSNLIKQGYDIFGIPKKSASYGCIKYSVVWYATFKKMTIKSGIFLKMGYFQGSLLYRQKVSITGWIDV